MFIPHLKYFGPSLEYIPHWDGLSFINVCDILSHMTDQCDHETRFLKAQSCAWSWDLQFQSKASFEAGVQDTLGGLPWCLLSGLWLGRMVADASRQAGLPQWLLWSVLLFATKSQHFNSFSPVPLLIKYRQSLCSAKARVKKARTKNFPDFLPKHLSSLFPSFLLTSHPPSPPFRDVVKKSCCRCQAKHSKWWTFFTNQKKKMKTDPF